MKVFGGAIGANLVVLAFIGILACSGTQSKDKIEYPKEEYSVVSTVKDAYYSSISVLKDDGKVIGSGVILYRTKGQKLRAVTNFHVIDEFYPPVLTIQTVSKDYKTDVRVIYTDPVKDLALLEGIDVEEKSGPVSQLAGMNPERGAPIWIIGNPLGHQGNITQGILSMVIQGEEEKTGVEYYRTDTAIFFGNSGGGVFDKEGHLIGIAVGIEMIDNGPFPPTLISGGGICISLKTLKQFLVEIT